VPAVPRVLSASHTPLLKFGLPPVGLWLAARVAFGWVKYNQTHEQAQSLAAAVVAATVVIMPLLSWSYARLKRVALTEDALHVSNFRREIVVPVRDVDRVRQPLLSRDLIVVDLARDTDFGRRIVFQPKGMYPGLFFWTHPIVDRLRDAVADAKKRSEAAPLTAGR
jgi:hypothetical protein